MPLTIDRSPDTDAVIKVLRGVNHEIAYDELAQRAGLELGRMKAVLQSARRVLRADSGILFGVIWGEGLRRLTDQDKVNKPEAFLKRTMRGAGREIRDLGTIVHFERLSKGEQHKVTTHRTVLNVIRQQSRVRPEEPKKPVVSSAPLPDTSKLTRKR